MLVADANTDSHSHSYSYSNGYTDTNPHSDALHGAFGPDSTNRNQYKFQQLYRELEQRNRCDRLSVGRIHKQPFTTYVPGYQNLDVGNTTSYPVTGLNPGTTYYYRVRAYNGCATSSNSSVKSVKTTACTPSAPSVESATNVTFSSFSANWSSVSGAIDYRLDVSTSSSFTTYVPGYQDLDVGNVTSLPVTGLNPRTTYYYRVRAYNGCATSSNSSSKSVTTLACTPAAPSAQSATNVTSSSFSANWSSVSGAIDYRLDVSTSSSFTTYVPGYQDLSVGNVTSFSVTGLNSQTIYYYRVRAYNGCNTSANSSVITVDDALRSEGERDCSYSCTLRHRLAILRFPHPPRGFLTKRSGAINRETFATGCRRSHSRGVSSLKMRASRSCNIRKYAVGVATNESSTEMQTAPMTAMASGRSMSAPEPMP